MEQAFNLHPFAVMAGFALIILFFFIGWGILMHGWPKFGKK
jgi:hypothetical protein